MTVSVEAPASRLPLRAMIGAARFSAAAAGVGGQARRRAGGPIDNLGLIMASAKSAPGRVRPHGRGRYFTAASAVALINALACAGAASAQVTADVYDPPPAVDYGAGLAAATYSTSGQLTLSNTDLTIGPAGAGGLSFERQYASGSARWRHNWLGAITDDSFGHFTVSVGAHSEIFTSNGSNTAPAFTPNTPTGSTLTTSPGSAPYIYTTSDGTIYSFNPSIQSSTWRYNIGPTWNDGQLTQITKPDGEVITLSYTYGYDAPVLAHFYYYIYRLVSVVSSRGYILHLDYLSNDQTTGNEFTDVSQVTGINLAVNYCAPTAISCAGLPVVWPMVAYSNFTSTMPGTVTDALGNVTN